MNYLEVSQKISLTKEATQDEFKRALLERLRRAFRIDALTEKEGGFRFGGTTGGGLLARHARFTGDVTIMKNQENVRVVIHGNTSVAQSLAVLYCLLFVVLLLLGLAPGSIETGYDRSGAGDALVFLIFGIFIFYDINKKLAEPREHLESILKSLNAEFG